MNTSWADFEDDNSDEEQSHSPIERCPANTSLGEDFSEEELSEKNEENEITNNYHKTNDHLASTHHSFIKNDKQSSKKGIGVISKTNTKFQSHQNLKSPNFNKNNQNRNRSKKNQNKNNNKKKAVEKNEFSNKEKKNDFNEIKKNQLQYKNAKSTSDLYVKDKFVKYDIKKILKCISPSEAKEYQDKYKINGLADFLLSTKIQDLLLDNWIFYKAFEKETFNEEKLEFRSTYINDKSLTMVENTNLLIFLQK